MASEFIARKTATYRVVCTSPDVCKVPKNTPVPFPIQEMLSSSTKTSTKTFANGCEIFTYESYTTKVTGDQPGVRKGIKSGTVGEAARPIEYSFSVYVEGVRIVRVNDACEMNEGNTVGKVVYAPPPKADKITDEGKIDSIKDEFIKGMCIQRGLDAEACAKVKHLDYWKERGEELYTSMKNKAESITSDQVVSAINDAAETVSTTIKDTISFYQHASKEQIVSGAEALGERVIEVGEEMLSDTWDWVKGTYDNLANSKSVAEGAGVLSAAVVGAVNPGKKIEKLSEGLEKLGKLDGPGKEKKDKKSEPEEGGSVVGKQFSACGDREKYGKSKRTKKANNGEKGDKKINFHRDHIPADSVMQARAKDMAKAKGKKVCSKAKKAIRNGAITIMLPDFIHIDGRTYGGKVKRRFEWDKNNLGAAAKDDIQAVKDATEKAYKKKKISKKCKDQIIAATEQMAKKSKAYTDMISKALDLCD